MQLDEGVAFGCEHERNMGQMFIGAGLWRAIVHRPKVVRVLVS